MAAERTTIELQKINEFVSQLDGLVDITSAVVYGVDADGNSVKLTVRQLTDHTEIESRLTTVETKAETNRINIATIIAALPSKSNVGHTHTMSDVTDLATELNGKSDVGHIHAISNITDLSTELGGKANAVHVHTISDVENLSAELNGKSDVGHGHTISDVAGLQGELDNKAPLNHTHSIPEIEQLQTQIQEINSEVTDLNTDVNQITIAAGMPQVEDLTTYTAAAGKVVQYVGETTSDYKHGYIYQYNQVGDPVEVPAGYWYRNLANGHILRLTNTSFGNKQSQISTATLDGLTYYIIGGLNEAFHSETEVDWDTIIQEAVVGKMLIPCSNGSYYKVSELVGESSQASNGWFWNFRSMVLDNGVEITWQDIDRVVIILNINKIFEDPSDVGTIYYGNNYGGELCPIISKVHIDNDNSQFKLIPTEPIGYIFTGSEHYEATATTVTTMQWQQTLVQPDSRIYFDDTNSKIQIKDEFGNVKSEISAAAFLKDGMIQSVELVTVQEQGVSVEVPYLKFVFNTDAGQQPIRLSLHDISAVTTGVLEQVDDMTNYTGASPNKIIQYTGTSTTDYINGQMYKYNETIPVGALRATTVGRCKLVNFSGNDIFIEAGTQLLAYGTQHEYAMCVISGNWTPTGEQSRACVAYAKAGSITDYVPEYGTRYISVEGACLNISDITISGNYYTITTSEGSMWGTLERVPCYVNTLKEGFVGGASYNIGIGWAQLYYPTDSTDGRIFITGASSARTPITGNYPGTANKSISTTAEYAWQQHDCQPRDGDYSNATVEFTEPSDTYSDVPTPSTELPRSGWSLKDKFVKVYKWLASLKKVCFTGSYNDLTDKLQNATTSAAGLMSAEDKKKVKQINNFTINAPASAINSNTAFGIMCYNLDLANFQVSISGDWSTGTFGQVNFGVSGRRTYGYFIEKNGICVSKSTYTINIAEYNNKLYIYAKFSSNYRSAITVLINGLLSDSDFTNLNFEILNESNFSNIKSIQITSL